MLIFEFNREALLKELLIIGIIWCNYYIDCVDYSSATLMIGVLSIGVVNRESLVHHND